MWIAVVLAIALVIAAVLNFGTLKRLFGFDKNQSNTTSQTSTSSSNQTNTNQPNNVSTKTFSYDVPDGWILIGQKDLSSYNALNGIKSGSAPVGSFFISTVSAGSSKNIKKDTLTTLKKHQSFKLIDDKPITISQQKGEKFSYSFSDSSSAIQRQDLIVVVYKKQIYSLQFMAAEKDYDSLSTTFNTILNSFNFK
ncbi:MAG TPA: PsbP-related protein [Candidatus Saccharimonadales bacterium]|nr:PsbP-related protein [Candidatus Saccharimonadales bacterium]